MKLDKVNIDSTIKEYLGKLDSIKLPAPPNDVLLLMYSVKRKPLDSGPYLGVSFFEASNRILSDLVILFGVRQLLRKTLIGKVQLPFGEYEVALGVEGGNDLRATVGGRTLIGEAFNVAPSFFQTKKNSAIKKLKKRSADYRLLLFNSDAVNRPDSFLDKSEPSLLYLPVDVFRERSAG